LLKGLGLLSGLVGFVIRPIFGFYEMPIPAYLVLLTSALVDMVLYYRVPDVTICYRCLGQYRGAGSNPGGRFKPFDLAVGERYRQEGLRGGASGGKRGRKGAPSPPRPVMCAVGRAE